MQWVCSEHSFLMDVRQRAKQPLLYITSYAIVLKAALAQTNCIYMREEVARDDTSQLLRVMCFWCRKLPGTWQGHGANAPASELCGSC